MDGVEVKIDYSLLKAEITFPVDYFQKEEIIAKREEELPAESLGLYIDYDFMYYWSDTNKYFKGYTDLNVFFHKNVFTQSFYYTKSDSESKLLRTATTLLIQDVDNIRNIKIGDVTTNYSLWNSSLRVGGISIATDFSMRPDLITYPLPDFAGETALPSTIDIYSKNAKVFSKDLKPGVFEIKDIPVTTPEGNIRVVIRDLLGRERVVEIPFSTHRKLLKEGLSKYSFTAGLVRKNYLDENFNYHNFIVSGSYQYGLTNKITLGFDGYLDGYNKGNIGVSPIILVPRFGLINPSLAVSYNENTFGSFYGLSYEKNFTYFRFRAQYKKSSKDFLKPGTVFGDFKESLALFTSFNIPYLGPLSVSYFDRKYYDSPSDKNLNVSFAKKLFNRINFSATYNKNFSEDNAYEGYRLSLSMPLGSNHNVSLTGSANSKGQENYSFYFSKSNPNALGAGYYLRGTRSNGSDTFIGRLNYNTHYTSPYLDFSYNRNNGKESTGYRAGLYGSVIYIGNEIFFKRFVGSGFALVKIEPPVEGAEILVNNKKIGKTDKSGTLFVGNLAPYLKNEIRIDPSSLDMRTHIDKTISTIVPLRKHGYLIKFKSKKVNSVRLKIVFPDGSYPIPGLKFDVDDNLNVGIIGHNGKSFIENITAGKHIVTVDYGYGMCSFELEVKEEWLDKVVPYIGEYVCVPQTDTIITKKEKKPDIKPAKLIQNKKEEKRLKKFKKVSYKKSKKPTVKSKAQESKSINSKSTGKKRSSVKKHSTYTIEVGKFKKSELDRIVEEYEEFQKEVVKEGEIYKIYIGKFKTIEDAEKFKKIFKLNGKITVVRE